MTPTILVHDEPLRINIGANVDVAGLNFWRWLNSDVAPNMVNTVEVYSAGNWITLWESGEASPRISGLM